MAAKKTFLLRIDPALWAELERWAAADFRSVNSQIEYVLHQALAQRKGQAPAAEPPGAASGPPPASDDPSALLYRQRTSAPQGETMTPG